MKNAFLPFLLTATIPLFAVETDWNPVKDATLNGKPIEDLTINGRAYEVFQHEVKPEWGYQAPQQDTFVLIHPKKERTLAPLYVVLHSAGHDVISCVKCIRDVGNHDIYRSPDDFYAMYLDCRRNQGDWWWGGMHLNDANLTRKNSGGDPTPVERRVMDTVKWVIKEYNIDPNRVYLCGISMGGSGTLGIGMRNGDVFAAIKATVPAGVEHVSNRMYFPPQAFPENVKLPDPPIAIDFEPGDAQRIELSVRGTPIVYNVAENQLHCLASTMPLEPINGHIKLRILVDRTSVEVFGNDGQATMSNYFMPPKDNTSLALAAIGGRCKLVLAEVHELRSATVKGTERSQ